MSAIRVYEGALLRLFQLWAAGAVAAGGCLAEAADSAIQRTIPRGSDRANGGDGDGATLSAVRPTPSSCPAAAATANGCSVSLAAALSVVAGGQLDNCIAKSSSGRAVCLMMPGGRLTVGEAWAVRQKG